MKFNKPLVLVMVGGQQVPFHCTCTEKAQVFNVASDRSVRKPWFSPALNQQTLVLPRPNAAYVVLGSSISRPY